MQSMQTTNPYSGPSFPIADTMMTLLAVNSHTYNTRQSFTQFLCTFLSLLISMLAQLVVLAILLARYSAYGIGFDQ